jgi:hypothetical protein
VSLGNRLLAILDRLAGWFFEWLIEPVRGLPPLASLAVVSLLVAVFVLWVFRLTSDQERMRQAKGRMQAGMFEIRLFNDDPGLILRSLVDIQRHNLVYLRLSLVPLLWMIVPLILAFSQLQSIYGYRAFRPGETFLLAMQLREEPRAGDRDASRPEVQLRVPPGLVVETPDLWIPALGEIAWRIRAEQPGRYPVEVRLGNEVAAKEVRVTGDLARLAPVRPQPSFGAQLRYPVEPPLPASGRIRGIRVNYAAADIPVLGRRLPWMVAFFLLGLAFALLLRNRFRVTF